MTLIKCPECDKDISDNAFDCPSCGDPQKKRSPEVLADLIVGLWNLFWILILIIIVGSVLLLIFR